MQVEDLARTITKEIRHMLFTLRPLVLEKEGLIDALETMALKMKDTYQQNVVIDADAEAVELLDASKHTVIFQLAEEAVNNARKHARADLIRVRLKFLPKNKELAFLEIADNGVGFDVESVNESYGQRGSLGMINLQERTDLINGMLRIDSIPGKGTRVQVAIPLTDRAADRLQRGLTGRQE
jgi:signal transduction histidine kinase